MAGVTGPDHALLVGRLLGSLIALQEYDPRPVYDTEHNYTDKIIVHAASGTYVVTVRPIKE